MKRNQKKKKKKKSRNKTNRYRNMVDNCFSKQVGVNASNVFVCRYLSIAMIVFVHKHAFMVDMAESVFFDKCNM